MGNNPAGNYVGSTVDLIGLTNTNDKRGIDRNNVKLRFKEYCISAGQTRYLKKAGLASRNIVHFKT